MIIWLLLGFLGVLEIFGFGSVANYAHLGGLISGLIFGMLVKILGKTLCLCIVALAMDLVWGYCEF